MEMTYVLSYRDFRNCTWCVTLPLEILNSQLSHHVLYSKLLCQMNRLNVSEVHNILTNDFNWNKTANMVRNEYKLSISTLFTF